MQETIFYVAAGETLGSVRDFANAKTMPAPTLVRGVSALLRMRLFAHRDGLEPYPIDALDAKSFDGQVITVTGYFNGLSSGGKFVNVIATKIAGANAKGTLSNPYTPAEAADAVKDLKWTSNTDYESTDEVYMKGKICKIANKGTYTEGGTYGNASFYLSADGTGDGEFYVFRALYLGNKKFEAGQTDIKVGDEVVVYGKLMNYQNNTPETVSGKAYLYSLNGKTE